jgi:hypothetical protein
MNVTVFFIGICAHIDNLLPSASRVVLPNASLGLRIGDNSVSPHIATLFIPAPFIAQAPPLISGLDPIIPIPGFWRMGGVQLELANITEDLTLAPDYCLPSLSRTAGLKPDLSTAVVDAGAAACVFQVTGGTLDTFLHGAAVLGSLTVDTDEPVLTVTRIWDQNVATIGLQAATIDNVQIDPVIFLSNTGADTDSDVDFLLHYRVTTFFPDSPLTPVFACTPRKASPDEEAKLKLIPLPAEGLTIGCSNSVYP